MLLLQYSCISQIETLNCLLSLLLGAYRLIKSHNFIRFPTTRNSQRAVAFNRSLIQIWHAPGKTNHECYTKELVRQSCQHVTLGFPLNRRIFLGSLDLRKIWKRSEHIQIVAVVVNCVSFQCFLLVMLDIVFTFFTFLSLFQECRIK